MLRSYYLCSKSARFELHIHVQLPSLICFRIRRLWFLSDRCREFSWPSNPLPRLAITSANRDSIGKMSLEEGGWGQGRHVNLWSWGKSSYCRLWSCEAVAELRLNTQKDGGADFVRKTRDVYTSMECDWDFSCFLTWEVSRLDIFTTLMCSSLWLGSKIPVYISCFEQSLIGVEVEVHIQSYMYDWKHMRCCAGREMLGEGDVPGVLLTRLCWTAEVVNNPSKSWEFA